MRVARPRVSVLLPYRNAAPTLPACLASIAAQTLTDYEVLAVDDGSTDASTAIVAAHASRDARIRCLATGGQGLVAALNLGLAEAASDLVARMDADDLMRPERLARQLAFLEAHPEVDVVGCQVRKFPDEQVKAGYREYLRWQNGVLTCADMRDEIYVESPLAHPSVCFRCGVVRAAGGYRDGPFPEDYELWLRLDAAGRRLAKVEAVLLDWREGEGRLSRVDPRYARAAFDRLRADYLARDPRLHTGRPLVVWGAGRPTRQRARRLLVQGIAIAAWIDIDPRKIGRRYDGVPVVAPAWLDGARLPEERPFVLVYVTRHGARELIAAALGRMGYGRGRDYLMVG